MTSWTVVKIIIAVLAVAIFAVLVLRPSRNPSETRQNDGLEPHAQIGRVNLPAGLQRIAIVLKLLATLWFALALYGFLFEAGDWFTLIVFGAGGSGVLLTIAWIIDGFAHR